MSLINHASLSLVMDIKAHRSAVVALAYHPTEPHKLLSAGRDDHFTQWQLALDKEDSCVGYKFEGHKGAVTAVDYAPNGCLVASGSKDRTVRLWQPKVNGLFTSYRPHLVPVTTVQFSPTNAQILSGAADKCAKEYDLQRLSFLRSFIGHGNAISCATYGNFGRFIATCADDRSIRLWDSKIGSLVHNFAIGTSSATNIAFHPLTDSYMAAAMSSGSVRIYDLRVYKVVQHYFLHGEAKCTSVSWHPTNGNYMLTAGLDNNIRIVDVKEGRPIYTVECGPLSSAQKASGCGLLACQFSPDGQYFATAGNSSKNIKIYKSNFVELSSCDELCDSEDKVL